jgi:hypothetical protein
MRLKYWCGVILGGYGLFGAVFSIPMMYYNHDFYFAIGRMFGGLILLYIGSRLMKSDK